MDSKRAIIVGAIIIGSAALTIFAIYFGFGSTSPTPISLMQHAESSGNGASYLSVGLSGTRPNDILIVSISYYQTLSSSTPSISPPTDSQGNSYKLGAIYAGVPGCTCYLYSAIYYIMTTSPTSDTITVFFTSPPNSNPAMKVNVFEIINACDSGSCVHGAPGAALSSETTSAAVAGNLNPNGNSAIFAVNTAVGQGGGVSAGGGYTLCSDASCEYAIYYPYPEVAPFSYGAPNYYVEAAVSFQPNPLKASISATPSSGSVPLTVAFSAVASGGVSPYSYSWNFADGGSSTQAQPTHTYTTPGTYLVQLTVTDSSGANASATTIVTVQASTQTTSQQTTSSSSCISFCATQTTTTNSQSSTSTSTNTSTSSSSSRISNWPPSLFPGWESSNLTVYAMQIGSPITLSSNLEISGIQSTREIANIAFNSNVAQFEFMGTGSVSISLDVGQKPSSVWADSTQITTWFYSNGVLSITADPSTITIFFSQQSPPLPPVNIILAIMIVVVAAAAFGAAVRRRS